MYMKIMENLGICYTKTSLINSFYTRCPPPTCSLTNNLSKNNVISSLYSNSHGKYRPYIFMAVFNINNSQECKNEELY